MQFIQEVIPGILSKLGIKALNDMQQATLKAAVEGDVVLRSPTGSGKTLAFLLPVLERLETDSKSTQAMIVAPSRELAQQIESVWKSMGTGFKITSCYGGHKRETEENNLIEPPAVIVGTPGRLADHIRRGNITSGMVTTLVLDEFDKSLELGFGDEMSQIITALSGLQKRILTSATEATEIPEFVGVTDPQRLVFEGAEPEEGFGLAVQVLLSPEKDKLETLFLLLCELGARPSIIFCNHRESVTRTSADLSARGLSNVYYHGAMEQQERDAALSKFRNGSAYFLVTTDLAARGLDIPHIRYIIHYHLPLTPDAFTHRNGRTARVDKSGTAIVIVGPDEKLPPYISSAPHTVIELPEEPGPLPEKPQWTTLFIAAGKKDKVNKVDIVGFLSHIGSLKKDDIGLIEVKDYFSFVAVRTSKATILLPAIQGEKIKGKKVKIEVAR